MSLNKVIEILYVLGFHCAIYVKHYFYCFIHAINIDKTFHLRGTKPDAVYQNSLFYSYWEKIVEWLNMTDRQTVKEMLLNLILIQGQSSGSSWRFCCLDGWASHSKHMRQDQVVFPFTCAKVSEEQGLGLRDSEYKILRWQYLEFFQSLLLNFLDLRLAYLFHTSFISIPLVH